MNCWPEGLKCRECRQQEGRRANQRTYFTPANGSKQREAELRQLKDLTSMTGTRICQKNDQTQIYTAFTDTPRTGSNESLSHF